MKKNVWIFNHYATNQFYKESGRHYSFAGNLAKRGYSTTIFCANTRHNSNQVIDVGNERYKLIEKNNTPYVFVKAKEYQDNGKSRLLNMLTFYQNLKKVAKSFTEDHAKPDVIIASSVHPLTLVAGIQIAKWFNIPCICEVRDLWPESLIAYGSLKRESLLAKVLYQGEKWIYKKADRIIMTWEGGVNYLKDQGWDKVIDLNKVKHLSNGVDLEWFDENAANFQVDNLDLENTRYKNLIYAGSIRKVNNLKVLIDAAQIIQKKDSSFRFLIYGDGNERQALEDYCQHKNIRNVVFKGQVEGKYIPFILEQAYANILHNTSTSLDQYGQSQNKFFEYLAAGRCIVQTYKTNFSILEKFKCGVSSEVQTPQSIAETILSLTNKVSLVEEKGENARKASYSYDFGKLTNQLIQIIEDV